MTQLEASYRACRRVVRSAGSNFPWTFYVLPRDKRRGMEALYAFARRTDDIGDSPDDVELKRAALSHWRRAVAQALEGTAPADDELLPALLDTVQRFEIPRRHLYDLLDGVERDLTPVLLETVEEMLDYCSQVASSIGLACVYIWGYTSEAVFVPAASCGVAFQMTNILRDLQEDLRRDRFYLPHEDLLACGLSLGDLQRGENEPALQQFLDLQFATAEAAYSTARQTTRYLSRDGRRIFPLMFGTYDSLFRKLRRQGTGILRRRVRLSWSQKFAVAARSVMGMLP